MEKTWNDKEAEILKLRTKSDKILDAIDDERIARARLTELSIAYGTLFDMRILIEGLSTENISIFSHIVEASMDDWKRPYEKK